MAGPVSASDLPRIPQTDMTDRQIALLGELGKGVERWADCHVLSQLPQTAPEVELFS
jgi:hypothetical protein